MLAGDDDIVVPVIREDVHVDAVPVETGGIRIIKRPLQRDETFEQELRKGRVEVKRVETNRIVDGPQAIRREGNTTIIPVVSEVLKIEKQLVVTEEIHITQVEERETVRRKVTLESEEAQIERFDSEGRVPTGEIPRQQPTTQKPQRTAPRSLVKGATRRPPSV